MSGNKDIRLLVEAANSSTKYWSTAEIVGALLSLLQVPANQPWWTRIWMKQWTAAILAAIGVFVNHAMLQQAANELEAYDTSASIEDWINDLK
jgi:hypothetical protein